MHERRMQVHQHGGLSVPVWHLLVPLWRVVVVVGGGLCGAPVLQKFIVGDDEGCTMNDEASAAFLIDPFLRPPLDVSAAW